MVDTASKTSIEAQQAFVKFTHANFESYSLAKFKNNAYSVVINLTKDGKALFNDLSGNWEAEVIVGDNSLKRGLNQKLGSFSLALGDVPSVTIREILKENFNPARLIEHTFKTPDARPSQIVSFVFAAIVLSPLLLGVGLDI